MGVVVGTALFVSFYINLILSLVVIYYKHDHMQTLGGSMGGRHTREAPTRQTDAVVESKSILEALMRTNKQILKGKCFDRAPNCKKELCENHQFTLWKKCKKTCGHCDPVKNKSGTK